MKTPARILASLCILAATAAACCTPPPLPAEPPAMTYDTDPAIREMPRCKGTLVEKFPCCALLRAADGAKFWIGSPGATSEVVRFVATLEEGADYEFPQDYLKWRNRGRMRAILTVLAGVLRSANSLTAR